MVNKEIIRDRGLNKTSLLKRDRNKEIFDNNKALDLFNEIISRPPARRTVDYNGGKSSKVSENIELVYGYGRSGRVNSIKLGQDVMEEKGGKVVHEDKKVYDTWRQIVRFVGMKGKVPDGVEIAIVNNDGDKRKLTEAVLSFEEISDNLLKRTQEGYFEQRKGGGMKSDSLLEGGYRIIKNYNEVTKNISNNRRSLEVYRV